MHICENPCSSKGYLFIKVGYCKSLLFKGYLLSELVDWKLHIACVCNRAVSTTGERFNFGVNWFQNGTVCSEFERFVWLFSTLDLFQNGKVCFEFARRRFDESEEVCWIKRAKLTSLNDFKILGGKNFQIFGSRYQHNRTMKDKDVMENSFRWVR